MLRLKSISVLLSLLVVIIACGCKSKNSNEEEFPYHGPPYITVFFVPMDGISKAEVEELMKNFKDKFGGTRFEPYFVESFEAIKTPDSCMNQKYHRLDAKKVLSFLKQNYSSTSKELAKKNGEDNAWTTYHVIGVTDRDISTGVHGRENYGILGLTYRDGSESIISTYRLRRKQDLWKLAAHEMCHGFYGAKHCPNDDPSCLLADAKGGNPHFEKKDTLCRVCSDWCLSGD